MDEELVELPGTDISLASARRTLAGLHFAKEALSDNEKQVLYLAEGLLRLIEQTHKILYESEDEAVCACGAVLEWHWEGVDLDGKPIPITVARAFSAHLIAIRAS